MGYHKAMVVITRGYFVFIITCKDYTRLTFARFEHFVCHGSLMTTHTYIIYIHLIRILTLTTKKSHCSEGENHKSLVLPQKQIKDYLFQATLTF